MKILTGTNDVLEVKSEYIINVTIEVTNNQFLPSDAIVYTIFFYGREEEKEYNLSVFTGEIPAGGKTQVKLTIDFEAPLLSEQHVPMRFNVIHNGTWEAQVQDSELFTIKCIPYAILEIINIERGSGRKETEINEIDVEVMNDGNAAFNVKVSAYVDDEEILSEIKRVESKSKVEFTLGWTNVEPGKYDVAIKVQAVTGYHGNDIEDPILGPVQDEGEIPIEIEEDSEIPWTYWAIFGIAIAIILVIIAVIIKTNRKKGDEEEEEEIEEPDIVEGKKRK